MLNSSQLVAGNSNFICSVPKNGTEQIKWVFIHWRGFVVIHFLLCPNVFPVKCCCSSQKQLWTEHQKELMLFLNTIWILQSALQRTTVTTYRLRSCSVFISIVHSVTRLFWCPAKELSLLGVDASSTDRKKRASEQQVSFADFWLRTHNVSECVGRCCLKCKV